ncbi:MAG: iron-containing alcohol dehydrogenase [Phyllobacterium sp.]|nr:iron-containing alcohol dehydrogenase [Phyllobacterium sp.]
MSKLISKWNYPTTVRFGAGRIKELPEVLEATGIKKPLFVTDPGLAKLPVVASTLKILDDAKVPYGVFSEVKPNPVESNLTAGIAVFKKGKHDGVIADPELSVGMPAFITAGTGMDALAHCLEAYCAPGYHPMADGIAVEGIRLVFENLPKAYANGKDLTARAHMMSAAAMGATAFQKGLGAIHSLSHPIGALYDTHHGMTNAVFMPYVLAFNRDAVEERIARLASYIGIKGGFDGFAKAIIKLRKELKVPHALPGLIKDLNMSKKQKELIADMAIVDPTAGGNPVKLTKKAALKLLDEAIEG